MTTLCLLCRLRESAAYKHAPSPLGPALTQGKITTDTDATMGEPTRVDHITAILADLPHCTICHGPMEDPVSMPCAAWHTFSRQCMHDDNFQCLRPNEYANFSQSPNTSALSDLGSLNLYYRHGLPRRLRVPSLHACATDSFSSICSLACADDHRLVETRSNEVPSALSRRVTGRDMGGKVKP